MDDAHWKSMLDEARQDIEAMERMHGRDGEMTMEFTLSAADWRRLIPALGSDAVPMSPGRYPRPPDLRDQRIRVLEEALRDADACITEELNLSNYDHDTVCKLAAEWDEAHGIVRAALDGGRN